MDKQEQLIISHDELMNVCRVMMSIILENDLTQQMETQFSENKINPGFSTRAVDVQEKFSRERLMLIATGGIQ